jgi:hypothetical protein
MPRRSVAIALLLLSLTGCLSQRAKYGLAGGTIAAGVYLVAIAPAKESCDAPSDPDDLLGIGSVGCDVGQAMRASFLTVGIAAIVTGVLALAMIDRAPSPPSHDYLEDRIVGRLTAQAVLAARSGDCPAVRILVERIARRDAEVVIDDPAIAGCLR